MAETADKDSKTEEPTERRIREAIEKGNIPVSREAPIFASMVGILAIASFFLADRSVRLSLVLRRLLDDPGGWSLENGSDAGQLLAAIGFETGRFLLPVIATLTVAGLVASFLQNAPSFAFDRIKPQLSRISPQEGVKRIFGMRGQAEFLKATVKFIAVAIVVMVILQSDQLRVMSAMYTDPAAVPALILSLAMKLLAAVSVATIVIVAADLVWARVTWRRELRMTRQDLKDEFKQSEGDPLVKARLRSLARDRTRRRMIAAVPRATLVIVNPTHYAVALRYHRNEGGAPLVVAKGQDLIALKIREVAEEHDIPVVEDKPLARSLYESVEVDRMIPPEFYKASGGDHPLPARPEPGEGERMMTETASPLGEDSHAADREKALADVAKELAAELRLTDVVDLITFIRTDNHPNINDLVNSSAELYLKPGTLSYGWAAEVDMRWTGTPSVKLDLEFQNRQVTAFFKLILEARQAGVELSHVEFEAAGQRTGGKHDAG